jgi:hypothetical protein
VPDVRVHRGPHPDDAKLFAAEMLPRLREAVADFSLLLTKGYAGTSALKLVGDHFSLTKRQRLAVMRAACSDQQRQSRLERRVPLESLPGRALAIDGYNLLITTEAALSGGLIFRGRDGCFRDLASIHGTYRKVEETIPAVTLIGNFLTEIGISRVEPDAQRPFGPRPPSKPGQACPEPVEQDARDTLSARTRIEGVPPSDRGQEARDTSLAPVLWLLDSPVSNSGRLKTLIARIAREHNWPWEIRLTISPDAELSKTEEIVVSTDSIILDACQAWTNLAAELITQKIRSTPIIDLGSPGV